MESEEALRTKLELLQAKFDEFRSQTDEYEEYLELELKEKDGILTEETQKYQTLLEDNQKLRDKYTRNEAEIVQLQRQKESIEKQLKVFQDQNRELENLNDHWEKSARELEFYKQDLEDKLYQAEESAIMYKEELDELASLREIEVQRLKEKCSELSQEIGILRAQNNNSARVKELEEALAKALEEQKELSSRSTSPTKLPETHAIRVITRVKPFVANDSSGCAVAVEGNSIYVHFPKQRGRNAGAERKQFNFEAVLGPETTEEQVFSQIRESLDCAAHGGRACILAYGQTGSGKTHTMNDVIRQSVNYLRSYLGVTDVRLSCIEIYNEMIRNLLGSSKLSKNWKETVCSAEKKLAGDWSQDALDLINTALSNRATKFTESNKQSSRSHSIYTLSIGGQIQFVDLAGSERIGKSQAKGDVLKESLLINKSLSALQDVIAALENKQAHVPYRNSMLTQVLHSTLGGAESYVTVILNCSSLQSDAGETVCTLSLGNRLKSVDLSFNLRQSLTNQEVERTLNLLEKERVEKQALLRKIEKLERDLEGYSHAVKDREHKAANLAAKAAKAEKDKKDETELMRKELASLKVKNDELSKKLRVLKVQADNEKQAKTKALMQLQNKQEQIKRVISTSPMYPRRPPSAPPTSYVNELFATPSRIPKPRFACNLGFSEIG